MKTVLTTDADEAADFIRRGSVVAFPTETVYGLGADILNESAVGKIFEAKRRPADNPLIAHIADIEQISKLASEVPATAVKLIDAFFPGPLTIVLRKAEQVPLIATAGLNTIGIRMPAFPPANAFLRACGRAVAAPSANLSGRPSPTTWEAVYEDLNGRIDCILQGEPTGIGLESTVVDCTGDVPLLLRKGSVSLADLQAIIPEVRGVELSAPETVRSPGLRHKHYSPKAKVVIAKPGEAADASSAFIGLSEPGRTLDYVRVCRDPVEYARVLFEFLRECDRRGIATIYCEPVDETGIGAALMDRLVRAAE